jgi:lactate permease
MPDKLKRIILYVFLPLAAVIGVNILTHNQVAGIRYFLAAAPILVVLICMTVFKVGGHYAGPIGLLTGLVIAVQAFGLTPQVLGVSQTKGLLLTIFVLAVFWPALFLYNLINQADGIQSIALALEKLISDRSILLIVLAWAFSGMLEGLAGFGLPVAIVSPMLVGLGISPILAVSAVAIGHAWAVTFGDMGVVFQTLISVVKVDPAALASNAALMLGIACLVCGLATAHIFGKTHRWAVVIVLAGVIGIVQYLAATSPIYALGSFLAGLSGVAGGILINRLFFRKGVQGEDKPKMTPALLSAVLGYGSLAVIMSILTVIKPVNLLAGKVVWNVSYPQVTTLAGFVTNAVTRQSYRPLIHPGASLLLVAVLVYGLNRYLKLYKSGSFFGIAGMTFRSAWPAMLGILSMVELSALMDHSGMTFLLAEVLSRLFQSTYPVVSPLIGMIGAFATGSNNNSNVLFGSLQEGIALILKLSPAIIVSAQTTGGALGSMIAPAKIIVGCSTVNLQGRDGEVLRKTIPYGLAIAALMGVMALILVKIL